MCGRPPPPRSHQQQKKKKKKRKRMPLFSMTVCWPTWAQETGHKPVLTTLCSSPERLIINRLKYSHCRLVFWPLAPMSKPLGKTCHVVRQNTPFIRRDSSVQEDLDGWFCNLHSRIRCPVEDDPPERSKPGCIWLPGSTNLSHSTWEGRRGCRSCCQPCKMWM